MASETNDQIHGTLVPKSIAERAPEAARASAHRAQRARSGLLRAREIGDFAMGTDRTDVRGWQVYSNDAELVGAVSSLFLDIRTKAVRYLGVALHRSSARVPAAEVLVPVGSACRPDDRQVVVIHALSRAQLLAAPRLPSRPVTGADEHAALASYGIQHDVGAGAPDLYATSLFDERRLFGTLGLRAALP